MQPQQSSRIDLGDLKVQIVKKIGADKSKRYFHYLNRFLSQKLGKSEFDKLCYRVLGRENISLHNQLLRSILRNACQAETPPPVQPSGPPKSAIQVSSVSPAREDGHEQSCAFQNQNQNATIWSNGVLPVSPRKGRSGIRDRKLRDRPSPLGPNGKVDCVSHQSTGTEDTGGKVDMENGVLTPCGYQRPVQQLQSVAKLPDSKSEGAVQRPAEKPRIHGKGPTEVAEENEEVEKSNCLSFSRGPLLAPLGIPYCSASVGGACRTLPVSSICDSFTFYDSGRLPDTDTLKQRMEQIAAMQGLGGVSIECANMLNNMLDLYLKRLISSCVDLVGARSTNDQRRLVIPKQQLQGKVLNGMWPNNHLHGQSSSGPVEIMPQKSPLRSVSLLDFKVAMELNPQQLGEDWPLLFEKIFMNTFGE